MSRLRRQKAGALSTVRPRAGRSRDVGHLSRPQVARLRKRLLRWFEVNRRDLPWRRTRDPYRIWLSEVLLQQTRVETARAYYERFVHVFPDLRSLAQAPRDRVLRLWSGLGYYRRAHNLHNAARTIMQRYGGRFPRRASDLQSLPGVGPYTAAAVASIAFDEPVATLDGNAKRVLARLFAVAARMDTSSTLRRLGHLAAVLLDPRRPGIFNQAVMELGATVCLPRRPRCDACPLRTWCAALDAGAQHRLPQRAVKRPTPVLHVATAVVQRDGRVLLVRRPDDGRMGGLWHLPAAEADEAPAARRLLRHRLRAQWNLRVEMLESLGRMEHLLSHRRLRVEVLRAGRVSGGPVRRRDACWVTLAGACRLPLSSLDRRLLQLLAGAAPPAM